MKGRCIYPGKTEGEALVSKEPIGFYGMIDTKTGIILEKGHELEGKCNSLFINMIYYFIFFNKIEN